jgi:hypothetical protein
VRLYHATWPTNLKSIRQAGLRPSNPFEGVYLANKAGYAAGFMRLRSVEMTGEVDYVDLPGHGRQPVPRVIQHDEILVCTINGERIDPGKLTESSDHAVGSGMFPADLISYAYEGTIPPSAIVDYQTFPF